jgi:hypothetical protein
MHPTVFVQMLCDLEIAINIRQRLDYLASGALADLGSNSQPTAIDLEQTYVVRADSRTALVDVCRRKLAIPMRITLFVVPSDCFRLTF